MVCSGLHLAVTLRLKRQVLIAECGEYHCLAVTQVSPLWDEARKMEDGIVPDEY